MTNQADTAVNKELAQELEGEGSAETQPIEASDAAEVSLEASEQAEDSAAQIAPIDEPVASTAESGDEAAAEARAEESSAPEAVEPVASVDEEPAASAEEEPAVPAASADDEDTEVIVKDDGSTQVVRMLAVGQQVDGVVKRITDFGAFVDIGVGRDGLIHISELSTAGRQSVGCIERRPGDHTVD